MKTEQKRGRKQGETFKNGYREERKFFIFKRPRRSRYYMCYYDVNGRRHIKAGDKSRERTGIMLGEFSKASFAGEHNIELKKKEKILFKKFSQDFIENYLKEKNYSWKSGVCNLKTLLRFFGEKYLYEITTRDIEDFIKARKNENKKGSKDKKISQATVKLELATLEKMFNFAIENNILHKNQNPMEKIKSLSGSARRERYLEREEINKLLSYCPEKLRAMIILAIHCGMRRSEIFNLQWDAVDFKHNIICVQKTKVWKTRKPEIKYPPMNILVRETLQSLKDKRTSDYVFPGKSGKRLTDLRKRFSTALEKAGIINFQFRDLKHTCVTQLLASGADIKTIQDITGNKEIDIIMNVYAHTNETRKRLAVDALCERLSATELPDLVSKIDTKLIPEANFENSQNLDLTQVIKNKAD